jgi:tripartite motif-containing protein 71
MALQRMVRLKLASPCDFRIWANGNTPILVAFAAMFFIDCAASQRPSPAVSQSMSLKPILNLQLKNIAGPNLGDNGSFGQPAGVAVDQIGEIFISDKAANAVYKFTPQLQPAAHEGGMGGSLGEFNRPQGMACDAALNLYITDTGNKRIQILDHNLHFVKAFETYYNENNEPVNFVSPSDITIDNEGNLWIADSDKILKLDPFFSLLLEISDRVPGQFIIGRLASIAASRDGHIAIGDSGKHRITIISDNGNFFGEIETGYPGAIAWDRDDNIWVADSDAGRILAYDINGNQFFAYADESPASQPSWLALAPDGNLVVTDSGLRKVSLYAILRAGNQIGK